MYLGNKGIDGADQRKLNGDKTEDILLLALHWLLVKFRICHKVAVISFKAIHNLRPILNDVLAITCGVMWALSCMTQPLSSNAPLGTDILLQLFQSYGAVYRTILRKRKILISLRDSLRRTILKRPIATFLELS